jgi:molybdenum cofactor guanylyltransferase
LKNTTETWAAISACDLPFASSELFQRLALFRDEKFDAAVPRQTDGRPQPLCAFYRPEKCLPIIETMLCGTDWSLQNLLRQVRTRFIEFDEIGDLPNSELFFLNINTPEDYDRAQTAAATIR